MFVKKLHESSRKRRLPQRWRHSLRPPPFVRAQKKVTKIGRKRLNIENTKNLMHVPVTKTNHTQVVYGMKPGSDPDQSGLRSEDEHQVQAAPRTEKNPRGEGTIVIYDGPPILLAATGLPFVEAATGDPRGFLLAPRAWRGPRPPAHPQPMAKRVTGGTVGSLFSSISGAARVGRECYFAP